MNGKAIGNKIKTLRTERGLTQKRLSEMAKVTPRTIKEWEKGNVPYFWDYLKILAKSLGTTVDSILDEG